MHDFCYILLHLLPPYPGAIPWLAMLGAVSECSKIYVSCYLQSASLVNRILPPFGRPILKHSVLHTFGALNPSRG